MARRVYFGLLLFMCLGMAPQASHTNLPSVGVGVPVALSPGQTLEWDLSNSAHLWQDVVGTIAVTTTSDPIGRIDETNGTGFNLLQSVSGHRPLYKPVGINSKPAMQGDGTSQQMGALGWTYAQPVTLYVVARKTANGSRVLVDGNASGAPSNFGMGSVGIGSDSSTLKWTGFAGGTQFESTSASDTTTAHVYTLVANGAASTLYIDGSSVGTGTIGATGMYGLTVGAAYNGRGSWWLGLISDVIIHGGADSSGTIASTCSALKTKWGTP